MFTSGILCSHIHQGLPSGRGGCQEPAEDSSSERDERSWVEGKIPTHPHLSPASIVHDGPSASLCAWLEENIFNTVTLTQPSCCILVESLDAELKHDLCLWVGFTVSHRYTIGYSIAVYPMSCPMQHCIKPVLYLY